MINDQKPYLFLDIDGVINIFPKFKNWKQGKHYKFWDEWKFKTFECNGQSFPFTYSPLMIDYIAELREYFDVVFLTTWVEESRVLLPKLIETNVLDFPVIQRTNFEHKNSGPYGIHDWWKVIDLEKFITKDPRNFVWFDDEYSRKLRFQVEELAQEHGVRGKLIRVYESYGLTKQNVQEAIKFINT